LLPEVWHKSLQQSTVSWSHQMVSSPEWKCNCLVGCFHV